MIRRAPFTGQRSLDGGIWSFRYLPSTTAALTYICSSSLDHDRCSSAHHVSQATQGTEGLLWPSACPQAPVQVNRKGSSSPNHHYFVKITFAKGAAFEDPSGLFNSSLDGNVRRAIDIHEGDKIDEADLGPPARIRRRVD